MRKCSQRELPTEMIEYVQQEDGDMGAVAYEEDFYGWTLEQARLLQQGKFDQKVFPAECPWVFEQFMDAGFWPEAVE